ncbi:MAG: hypothetical protein LBB23_01625 [Rickettsiales bacterium]|nr:hypothetical protein [Rickettsiales bacterium]
MHDYYHYPVRLRFATARHPFASEGDFCATTSSEGDFCATASSEGDFCATTLSEGDFVRRGIIYMKDRTKMPRIAKVIPAATIGQKYFSSTFLN